MILGNKISRFARTEMLEEGISNVAGNVADQVIMGELSNYSLLVQQLMQQGASREEAERRANYQLYLIDTIKSSFGGGISGGLMATSAQVVGAARQNMARRAANNAVNDAYRAMAQDGMFSDRARQAANTAAVAQQSILTPQMTVEQFNKARYETVRRNTEQQLDALIEPVRARVQQLESQMSTDPRDPLTEEYTKAKNVLNAYETIRDNRLREIDKMYGMAYTENQESRATWNEENRANWREQYGRGEAETAAATVYGGRRAVSHLDVYPEGSLGGKSEKDSGGGRRAREATTKTYQAVEGRRDENKGRFRYRYNAISREKASQKSIAIADKWTANGFPVVIYDGNIEAIGVNGESTIGNANATTLSDGTILLRNDADMPEAEILAHEPIHYYKKAKPEIYQPIQSVMDYSGIDIVNPKGKEVMNDLLSAYNKSHSLDDPFNTNKLYEELIAQISGHHANDPEFAREMFSPLINDYDGLIAAIENAHHTFAEQNSANQASEHSGAFSMPESGKRGGKIMEESVGAAVHDPNSYSALQGRYGTIEPGENPAREVDVPKKTDDTHKVRQFTRTMMEAEVTPDEFIPGLEEAVKDGKFSYTPKSNEKSLRKATKRIQTIGFDAAVSEFRAKVDGNERIRAEDIALGELILAEAGTQKDFELARQTYLDLAILFTESGQIVQIASALKKLGPSGKYYAISRMVDRIKNRVARERKTKLTQEMGKETFRVVQEAAQEAKQEAARDVSENMESILVERLSQKVMRSLASEETTRKQKKNGLIPTIRDILTESPARKKELVEKIQAYLLESNAFPGSDATAAAEAIASEFNRILQSKSEEILKQKLQGEKAPNVKEKDALSALEKYLRLGALNNEAFSDAAIKEITGHSGIVVPEELLLRRKMKLPAEQGEYWVEIFDVIKQNETMNITMNE